MLSVVSLPPFSVTMKRPSWNRLVWPLFRIRVTGVLLLFLLFSGDFLWASGLPLKDQPHLRRPVAGTWLVPNNLFAVATSGKPRAWRWSSHRF